MNHNISKYGVNLREEYWMKFSMQPITVIFFSNYQSVVSLILKIYSNVFLSLLWQFSLIPKRPNNSVNLRMQWSKNLPKSKAPLHNLFFNMMGCRPSIHQSIKPTSWRMTHCQLSTMTYSIYSVTLPICRQSPLQPQGIPCCSDNGPMQ